MTNMENMRLNQLAANFYLAIVVVVVVVVAVATPQITRAEEVVSANELQAWIQFKKSFNKTYANLDEDQRRMSIFIDNKRSIENHNRQTGGELSSFEQGLNSLSDLTTDEINQSRNGFRLEGSDLNFYEEGPRPGENLIESLLIAFNESSSLSSRSWYENLFSRPQLDYREQNRVSKVKDQGSCGACWAFATTGALESVLANRGRQVLLSEQNLVDCSSRYGNNGCRGGLMDAALRYVRDHGIMAARDYPYTAEDGRCHASPERVIMKVRGSVTLPRGNERLLRLALAASGPLPVAIDASAKSFHSYKSGIYDDRTCKSSPRHLNHAVLLVGYGTSKSGRDYWLLKNSWGRSWGDNGYIYMARNRGNLCGVATFAVMPLT